jgi:C4-dicarboxylate-specific signal transduction histidine kinase
MDAVLEQPAGERRIAIIVAAAGDMAEVSIADTGHGVPGQDAKKIFDSFFSTKKEGMGMGLSIRGHGSPRHRPCAQPDTGSYDAAGR